MICAPSFPTPIGNPNTNKTPHVDDEMTRFAR